MKKIFFGFTLIELILYISLASVFLVAAIQFGWSMVYADVKTANSALVNLDAQSALLRIGYEIERAQDIVLVSPDQIVLDNDTSTTTVGLSSGVIEITTGGASTYPLTGSNVNVESLLFTNLEDAGHNTKSIKVEMIVKSAFAENTHAQAQVSLSESFELNSSFNQSRKVLLDAGSLVLSGGGTQITGITLENWSDETLVIDKLFLDWTGTIGGESVNEIQIDGSTVEWTGSELTGSEINITDYTLISSSTVDLNYVEFSSSMSGGYLEMDFIMGDGSRANSYLYLGIDGPTSTPTPTPTNTPTPTSTPTPTPTPASCAQYCLGLGYVSGNCRQHSGMCSRNGEVYQSGGNLYCTGGPTADTCCCVP